MYYRLESLGRLSEIAQNGKFHDEELRCLNRQVAILKDDVMDIKSHSKLQNEARMVLEISELAISKVLQDKILEALRFERMESRFDDIKEAHAKTFSWLLEDSMPSSSTTLPVSMQGIETTVLMGYFKLDEHFRRNEQRSFTSWLSNGKGIFHISGKPGAGKSTLMKFLAGSDEVRKYLNTWSGEKELVCASFFFWRHGTDFEKSLQGLLRSILYSILDQQPDLTRVAFPMQWETASRNTEKSLHFRNSEIQRAFFGLMETPQVYLGHKFAFFIDGLDEFQGHDDTLIRTLFEWASSGKENVKICVSSRELPIFQQRFSKCPKFRLHELTRHDMFLFVYDHLQRNEDIQSMSSPPNILELVKTLVLRAEGVFLWVALALRLVERGLLLEDSIEDLKRSINALPAELEALFRVIFDSIKTEADPVKRRKAMRTLSLAVDEHELYPYGNVLYLTHLSFMDDYDRDKDLTSRFKSHISPEDMNARLSRCQKQLAGICRGLLSIRSDIPSDYHSRDDRFRMQTVVLAHRSLIEFFQIPEVRVCIDEHTQGFDRLHFYCQSLIAELKTWSPGLGMYFHLSQFLL